MTITVTDVNEPPDITVEGDDYAENGTGPVATFTATDPDTQDPGTLDLSGADASLFDLTDDGILTFIAPPNYEMPGDADKDNTYELTVGAKDADNIRGTKDVEVKVTNINEDGMVTLSAVQPRVGVSLTASLTDIDGPVSGVKWQWTINTIAIDDATSDTYTPVDSDLEVTLTVTATYTDPQGPEHTASGSSVNPVAADTRNKAPAFAADQDPDTEGDQAEAKRTVEENAAARNPVGGGVITATDPNANDELTYTLGGPDASSFDIDAIGQITVGAGTKLDYETKTSYMVTVIATDSFGASASIEVTITVTDVNEGPEITVGGLAISGMARVDYAEDRQDAVETYTASGPESDMATWSLLGDDAGSFTITGGVLAFRSAPDFENPVDMGMDNVYMVTVMANDGTYDAMRMVTVTVTKVDEQVIVGDSLLARYDADKDGWIQLEEARVAVGDYFSPPKGVKLSLADTRKVVGLYFEYKNSQ